MKKSRIAFVLIAAAPALMQAQSATTTASATAQAAAKADIPASYSADAQAKLTATFERARERKLPEQPIRDRVAEGQAKSATEAQVVIAAQRAEARLEAVQSAIVRAGRQPSDAELIRAEAAMARGATEAQVEAVARRAQPDREIVVALDALVSANATGANAAAGVTVATPAAGAAAGVTGAVTAGVGAVVKKPPMR